MDQEVGDEITGGIYGTDSLDLSKSSDSNMAGEHLSDKDDQQSDKDSSMSEGSVGDENKEQKERELVALEKQLAGNPYDYSLNVSVVNMLRDLGEFDRLRLARKQMHKLFPLSEQLWLDWLQDESSIATSEDEKKHLKELFESAVSEYLSVPVWLEYCQYTIGLGDIEQARAVFEKALQSAGLHVSSGAILWEAFREYELCILQTLTSIEQTPEEQLQEQKQRIEKLFKRQLMCPLLNNETAYDDYQKWKESTAEEVDSVVFELYEKSQETLKRILPFEEELLRDSEKREVYRRYMDFELCDPDPARILCLFERAVADCPLISNIWLDYINYIIQSLKDNSLALKVHEGSIRNCPWVGDLWCSYILTQERAQKPKAEIIKTVERAHSAGLTTGADHKNVWFSYIDYTRRQAKWEDDSSSEKELEELREILTRATQHVMGTFGLESDPECDLYQYWARLEFSRGSLEEARKLWTDILDLGLSQSAMTWLSYITLEQRYGDSKHVRKLYQRALQSETDWPELITKAWLGYERERGDLDQFELCAEKCAQKLTQVHEKRLKNAENEHDKKSKKTDRAKEFKLKRGKKDSEEGPPRNLKKKEEEITKEGSTVKRKASPTPDAEKPPKREKVEDTQKPEEFGVLANESAHPERTVFLSNLDYEKTEEDLKRLMSSSGKVESVRLVKNFSKKSKGFAYVVFSKSEEAEDALKRDRELVEGRPMFVSPYEADPTFKTPIFKYPNKLEKNKLFVKGLPKTTTKEDLEKLFEPHGNLKEVRIVTFRSGQPKGLAYVEYQSEGAAALAVVKMDGLEIEGLKIGVAISNPPPRKEEDSLLPSNLVASLGGGAKPVGARGKGRSQISLVPASVQRKAAASAPPAAVNGSAVSAKSNEDFRKMLLGSK